MVRTVGGNYITRSTRLEIPICKAIKGKAGAAFIKRSDILNTSSSMKKNNSGGGVNPSRTAASPPSCEEETTTTWYGGGFFSPVFSPPRYYLSTILFVHKAYRDTSQVRAALVISYAVVVKRFLQSIIASKELSLMNGCRFVISKLVSGAH